MERGSWARSLLVAVVWGLIAGVGAFAGFQRVYYEFWFSCYGDGDIATEVRLVSMARVAYAYPNGPFRLDSRISLDDLIKWGSRPPRYADLRCNNLVARSIHEKGGDLTGATADVDLHAFTEQFRAAKLRLLGDMQASAYMAERATARGTRLGVGSVDRGSDLFGTLYLLESRDGPVWAWELRGELENDHLLHEIAAVRAGDVIHERHFFQDVSGYEGTEGLVAVFMFMVAFAMGFSWEQTAKPMPQGRAS